MKRPVAMLLAGAFTAVAVIGGTVTAVQTGVFASSTITIQANGEINVPTSEPATEQLQATIEIQPTDSQTVTEAVADSSVTAAPIVVVDTSREDALMARLSEAYKLMKERDDAYQAKLMEAYTRLQANHAGVIGGGAVGGGAAGSGGNPGLVQSTAVPAAPVPVPAVVVRTGDQHDNQHTRNLHTSNTRTNTNAQQNNGNQQRNNDQQHTRTQPNTDSQQHNGGRKESGDH